MWEANAFTREDMFGTLYQRLLPVEIINYTPPTAVIFLVDTSGSMYQPSIPYEKSKLYAAIQGVKAALDGLTERDYVGVITLSDMPNEVLSLTSRTQRGKILDALDGIQYNAGGGTIFSPALEMAGRALIAHSGVINKHIVVITDGAMSNTDEERSRYCMRENANMGITMSIVGIDCTAYDEAKLCDILADQPNGGAQNFHSVKELDKIGNIMRDIVESPLLKDIQYQEFIPVIESDNSVVADIDPNNMPMLDGFYGSKLKEGAELILSNKYVPIYAQWTVGKGKVGSFMCDLNGTWSHDFIASDVGITIINKIISALSNSKDN